MSNWGKKNKTKTRFCSSRIHARPEPSSTCPIVLVLGPDTFFSVRRVLLGFHQSFISLFFLLPQSSNWRWVVFCFLKYSLSEMKMGTTAWQKHYFSHCFSNSSLICQSNKSTHDLEQGTAGFNAFLKKLFCVNVWKVLESIPFCQLAWLQSFLFFQLFFTLVAQYWMYGEGRNCWSSWTNLTFFHLNLFHVIRLPCKIYILDRDLSASCYITVMRENPEA